ncbi:uncharacterized protein METZ01_LOCUS349939 [marine metagenome]|uniref:Uncharacterized protein n=1 Tax=marine metagenome TaxID=408172 RepID=A0A382RIU8_9ZZZZ
MKTSFEYITPQNKVYAEQELCGDV